ncbi:hypothetical protein AC249_AIPGENE417 [Exaiptasia diaphana]|nr:hypothetical protein AC249_AIPGENE417 [Exaiptasia diaphana]
MKTYKSICRDFLVFLAVVDCLGSRAGFDPHYSQDISSIYIPKVVLLLRIYFTLHWISELDVTPAPSNAIEANLKQLAALEISDGNQAKLTEDSPKTTVMKLFLRKVVCSQVNVLMSKLHQANVETDIPMGVLVNQAIVFLAGSM